MTNDESGFVRRLVSGAVKHRPTIIGPGINFTDDVAYFRLDIDTWENNGELRTTKILVGSDGSHFQATEQEAEKIKQFARQEIEMFHKAKVRELRVRTAELATALAKASLEEKMTPERQVLLIDQSIAKIEDLYEE